jgi:hypothetical protein
VEKGSEAAVQLLIKHKANVNAAKQVKLNHGKLSPSHCRKPHLLSSANDLASTVGSTIGFCQITPFFIPTTHPSPPGI